MHPKCVMPSCIVFFLMLNAGISMSQPLPDSLQQQVLVSVIASPALQPHVQQYLELYLIEAEAKLVQENAVWELQVQVVEGEGEESVVALSLVATQPVSPSLFGLGSLAAETPTVDNPANGEWVKAYLAKESWKQVRMVQQHEVVIVASDALESGCAEIVRRFQQQQLNPLRRQFLQQ